MIWNTPMGTTWDQIDPPRICERCDEKLHSQSESALCDQCEAEVAQEENE